MQRRERRRGFLERCLDEARSLLSVPTGSGEEGSLATTAGCSCCVATVLGGGYVLYGAPASSFVLISARLLRQVAAAPAWKSCPSGKPAWLHGSGWPLSSRRGERWQLRVYLFPLPLDRGPQGARLSLFSHVPEDRAGPWWPPLRVCCNWTRFYLWKWRRRAVGGLAGHGSSWKRRVSGPTE